MATGTLSELQTTTTMQGETTPAENMDLTNLDRTEDGITGSVRHNAGGRQRTDDDWQTVLTLRQKKQQARERKRETDSTGSSNSAKLRKRRRGIPQLPPLPEDDFKIVIRPHQGLPLKIISTPALAEAIVMACDYQIRELYAAAQTFKKNTAPGPDQITNAMLHNLSDVSLQHLVDFFNEQHDDAFRTDTFIEEAVKVHMVPSMETLENTYKHPLHDKIPEGEVCFHLIKAKLNATIACLMNFRYFPMDTQTCTVTLRSYAYPKQILHYSWLKANIYLFNDRIRVPEYHVTFSEADQVSSNENDDTTGEEYSRLRLHIRFRRRIQRHLVDTFVPTAFLVILSWLSFWLGTSATQARVLLCGVVLVAVLEHLTAAREGLPPSRTLTGLDIWFILCLGFVSSSIVEVTFVCYCSDPPVHGGHSANPNTGVSICGSIK
ncbi:uncharacterized protein LOC142570597 [Dermacentor variabilis]|uniref:uncharacterized protein LOC142570597 n=1 Tax=Dermacentor variabilis TaxID=34621 RepID=UPI003F5C917C